MTPKIRVRIPPSFQGVGWPEGWDALCFRSFSCGLKDGFVQRDVIETPTSALGHLQTCPAQDGMSAFTPESGPAMGHKRKNFQYTSRVAGARILTGDLCRKGVDRECRTSRRSVLVSTARPLAPPQYQQLYSVPHPLRQARLKS